jgi:hypothetical protein
MIHKTYFSPVQATAETLQSAADAAILDDRRVEAILHKKITLSDERWTAHKFADQWLSAEEALEAKLVTEIGEFSPPMGIQLLYLGATWLDSVVPTGYSFNLDGTNYMTLTTLFIAQAQNVPLSLGEQLTILIVAMLTSKGASAVTGAGFITLAATFPSPTLTIRLTNTP